MKVVAYYRYSTDNEKQADNSERRQKDAVERLIYSKGWTLVESFTDHAVSGADDKPELLRMKSLVKSGDLDIAAICIDDLSRITRRSVMEWGSDLGWIKESGIKISLANRSNGDPMSVDRVAQELSLLVEGWQNNQYIVELSRKVANGMRTKFQDGSMGWVGVAPFGYTLKKQIDGPSFIVANEDLDYVREMFINVLGGGSVNSCIDILSKGSRYVSEGSRHPNSSSVKSVLRNAIYAGIRTFGVRGVGKYNTVGAHNRKWITENPLVQAESYCEYSAEGFRPCVTVEQFKAVQDILDRNQQDHKRFPERQKHLYSGLLRCWHCDSPLCASPYVSDSGESFMRYCCSASASRNGRCRDGEKPHRKQARDDELKDLIGVGFAQVIMDAEWHRTNLRNLVQAVLSSSKNPSRFVDEDIQIQAKRLDEIVQMFVQTGSESLKDAIRKQQEKIDVLKAKLNSAIELDDDCSLLNDYAKRAYENNHADLPWLKYFGFLYEDAVRVAAIADENTREEEIRGYAEVQAYFSEYLMSRFCCEKNPRRDLSLKHLFGFFSENTTAIDDLRLLLGFGLDHVRIKFELSLYRGQPRRVPVGADFVFRAHSVAYGNCMDTG